MDEYPVSRFQALTIGRLVELLDRSKLGYTILFYPIESEFNSYFLVKAAGLAFFIYDNGAQVVGPGIDNRFERQDYPNDSNKLSDAFLAKAELHLEKLVGT